MVNTLSYSVRFGLPDDYWQHYAQAVSAVTLDDVNAATHAYLRPRDQVFVVVGDRAKIEPGLQHLGFREIRVMDAAGY